jgi:flagellar assembly protein FliH
MSIEEVMRALGSDNKTPAPAGSRSRVISRPDRHDITPVPWMEELPPSAGAAQGFQPEASSAEAGRPAGKHPEGPDPAVVQEWEAKLREMEARLEQWQSQQPQLLREAAQRARQETEQLAQSRLEQEVQPWLLRMAQTIEDLSNTKRRFIEDTEEQVVRLAVAIARRILHREIQVDPEALLGLLRAAVGKSELREVHKILLHPLDRQALTPFLQRMDLPPRVEIVADNTLERGAVIIESSTGLLDASVTTQLDEVERGFADLMGRRA